MYNVVEGTIRAIRDHIIVTEMKFDRPVTKGGIILPMDDGKDDGIRPRWAQVYAIGPEQKDVAVDQWILVAHGRWTRGIRYVTAEGQEPITVRRVDCKDILLVSDTAPNEFER